MTTQREHEARLSGGPSVPLVLASASPRRQALLQRLGLPFVVRPSGIDEIAAAVGISEPEALARHLARAKAQAVVPVAAASLVVGCDTIVVIDGYVLGKPADAADACAMLGRLAGRCHTVFSGVAVVDAVSGAVVTTVARTRVELRPLTADAIAAYVATGEPMDKAGSYAAQGQGIELINRVDGCFANVVGLPLCSLALALAVQGMTLPPLSCHPTAANPVQCAGAQFTL